ncbi:efflux RND transporter periplasmic adaptor subunit [Xanthomonas oryzae]|uniref:efflux RND transporter periplasmic adaptor subunit n=1 Tax=Xanthomonas oryzae TaxID=347 RepID=UPI0006A667B0|nr:efflux RND transporter periplasmic adaptor subunit [Xanthomonas oryzae]AKJ75452.1 Cobalt-zinc-cadmium resistance protein czcB [Xanthomonas oryzae pv. oryzicola]UBB91438.1 efflux RND transporter periplasmic adaptor subunit [Xanthomonas oryzae pv. oryzicola]UBB91499.1 efflux RND transporter periplasmic adaptor subunit [Xanthomonas oryzae pv. oryzicola]
MKRYALIMLFPLLLSACGGESSADKKAGEVQGTEQAAADYERGPHRGRMLRDGDFALEVTVYETNTPPHFRLYAYRNDKQIAPAEVTPTIMLKRLDGEVNTFAFKPEKDYLAATTEVVEPHSFDVKVTAASAGKSHHWSYASYEGRTTIDPQAAKDAGVAVETAGAATIRDTVQLMGTIAVDANRFAAVKARFPGIVRNVPVQVGQRVSAGATLVTIEGNDSMRTYAVTAPFDGIVIARNTNVGDFAGDNTLVELANLAQVWVDLRAIGTDAERLAPGQSVTVRSATSGVESDAKVVSLLPLATAGQSVIARVSLPNPEGKWRPGMTVSAEVTVASDEVPLAVKESGLQRFRDFTVVFAQVGDTYEVRMLELGRRDGHYAEVLGGLKPGASYVSEQSYLIRADIEKSGASHDH